MGYKWFSLGKKNGYSLIELLVVLGVITLLILTAFPVVFGRNDRLLLDSSANMIRQVIIDARVRSIASGDSGDSRIAQFYQVAFETFNEGNVNLTVKGGIQANKISLERGKILCGSGASQRGATLLRQLRLPRGIYISKFYPSNQTDSDPKAAIRFIVGRGGFRCGNYENPIFNSVGVFDSGWSGNKVSTGGGQDQTTSRYLMIELASQKISDKRYIFVDRFTSEVIVSRDNIQDYFEPNIDTFSPKWQDISPSSFTLNINCRVSDSTIFIFYRRAEDRYNETETDPNLAVYYNLSWSLDGQNFLPLEQRYFYDLSSDIVVYTFITTAYSIANQPATLRFKIVAYDEWGRVQTDDESSEELKPRDKIFSGLSCGNRSAEETDQSKNNSQEDPFGEYSGCEVAKKILRRKEPDFSYLARLFGIELAQAQSFPNPDCDALGGPNI